MQDDLVKNFHLFGDLIANVGPVTELAFFRKHPNIKVSDIFNIVYDFDLNWETVLKAIFVCEGDIHTATRYVNVMQMMRMIKKKKEVDQIRLLEKFPHLELHDIEYVMQQSYASKKNAIKALWKHNGDVVDAIMYLG